VTKRSVLVVAAHPDDEVLGCGGTLVKLATLGASVAVAFLSDGVTSRRASKTEHARELAARRASAQQAAAVLGVQELRFGEFPDNAMDTVALLDVVRVVEAIMDEFKPDTVFTHHGGDLNVDHRRVCEAVATACRPHAGQTVRSLLAFEVASSTEWQLYGTAPAFVPNWFCDVTTTLDRKLQALDAYAAELRDWPHPRSRRAVEHLARWRGATIGAQAAEAFVLMRQLA
jgi:LmbE family N-acetylglucosaminyl deacetylase